MEVKPTSIMGNTAKFVSWKSMASFLEKIVADLNDMERQSNLNSEGSPPTMVPMPMGLRSGDRPIIEPPLWVPQHGGSYGGFNNCSNSDGAGSQGFCHRFRKAVPGKHGPLTSATILKKRGIGLTIGSGPGTDPTDTEKIVFGTIKGLFERKVIPFWAMECPGHVPSVYIEQLLADIGNDVWYILKTCGL